MSHVLGEDLLSAGTSVDAHHRHADGPGSVTDGHLQVGVIGLENNTKGLKGQTRGHKQDNGE